MAVLNLSQTLERIIADIAGTVPVFRHVNPGRVLVCVATTRSGGIHGTYARIHPLRFTGGTTTAKIRRGRRLYTCTMPQITHCSREILYLVYFLVPRFLDLPLKEKLITVFHELYHISPEFNGDIRRFPGRNYAHGPSRKRYNLQMAHLVDEYMTGGADAALIGLLDGDSQALRLRYRSIVGRKMAAPRLQWISE